MTTTARALVLSVLALLLCACAAPSAQPAVPAGGPPAIDPPEPLVAGNSQITVAPTSGSVPEVNVFYSANSANSDEYTIAFDDLEGTFEIDPFHASDPVISLADEDSLTVTQKTHWLNHRQDHVHVGSSRIASSWYWSSGALPDSVSAYYDGLSAGWHRFVVMIRLRGETQVIVVRGQS